MNESLGPVEAHGVGNVQAWLRTDAFAGYHPTTQVDRSASFALPEWRVVAGIPQPRLRVGCEVECNVSAGEPLVTSGYEDPRDVSTRADYRWLPSGWVAAAGQWECDPDLSLSDPNRWGNYLKLAAGFTWGDLLDMELTWNDLKEGRKVEAGENSWADLRDNYTWSSLRLHSYHQALNPLYSSGDATWSVYTEDKPDGIPEYTYWRSGSYVPNEAVGFGPGQTLVLSFNSAGTSQMTMLLTAVLLAPDEGHYTVLSASEGIHLRFTNEGEVQLCYGNDVLTAQALAGRSRPNEPVVVGISVSPLEQAIYLIVMDSVTRVVRGDLPELVEARDLVWVMGYGEDARMVVLEANLYTARMTSNQLAQATSAQDQIYGVTSP